MAGKNKPSKSSKKKREKEKIPRAIAMSKKMITLTPLEAMVYDPCFSPLSETGSEFGAGVCTFRVKSRIVVHSVAAASSGMLLWDPAYHNVGTDGTQLISGATYPTNTGAGNLFVMETPSFATNVLNTVVNPMGENVTTVSDQGRFLADPAGLLLSSGTSPFGPASLVGACVDVEYQGRAADNAGSFYLIRNLQSGTLTGSYAFSAASLANTGSGPYRNGSIPSLKYVPTADSDRFRTPGVQKPTGQGGGVSGLDSAVIDSLFRLNGANVSRTTTGLAGDGRMFGVVWTGLNTANTNDVVITLTKIFNATIRPIGGVAEVPPTTTEVRRPLDEVASSISRKTSPVWDCSSENESYLVKAANTVRSAMDTPMGAAMLRGAARVARQHFSRAIANSDSILAGGIGDAGFAMLGV